VLLLLVELLVKLCSVELDDDELVVKLKNVDEELENEEELEFEEVSLTSVELDDNSETLELESVDDELLEELLD